MTRRSAMLEVAISAVATTACGVSLQVPSDDAPGDQRLDPGATGWVDRSVTGTTGIQGQWRAWDTGARATTVAADFCENARFGECSLVEEPTPGAPYAPTPHAGMCTSGVIGLWRYGSDGITLDGSPGWAGSVFDFDAPYDAPAHGVTGLSFDLDSEPLPGSRLLVQLTSVAPPTSETPFTTSYWGSTPGAGSPAHAGRNELRWYDIEPKPFDPTQLVSVAFLVSGNDSHGVSYDFCVDNLTALRSAEVGAARAGVSQGQLLVPDSTGWVDRSTTGTTMIQGVWFAAADGDEDGKCLAAGHPAADCSRFFDLQPDSFPPIPDLGICVAGRLPKLPLAPDGTPDFGNVWGAILNFSLNAASFPERHLDAYDADRYGVRGFAFDIDSEPPPGAEIQVQVAPQATPDAAPWWGSAGSEFSPVHAGHNEFRFYEVGGPTWADDSPELDTSALVQVGFHLVPNDTHEVSFGFCIANLTALQD